MTEDRDSLAEALNRTCHCITVDAERLRAALESRPATAGLYASIRERQPNLFSASAVFVSRAQLEQMREVIEAVGAVVALRDFREHVLAWAPEIARLDHGPRGVFMGFDFHVGAGGPRLIEINTNAGGALLNTALAAAELACCPEVEGLVAGGLAAREVEAEFLGMFREEWRLQRRDAPLERVAIVDDEPEAQYLHPEFLLFSEVFGSAGIAAEVADPRALEHAGGRLRLRGTAVDLVYNRLTDFPLGRPESAALRAAYVAGDVLVTPHPRVHALYADKRNLCVLSDPKLLRRFGAPREAIDVLARRVPLTRPVDPGRADEWWRERKRWFFKPVDGYGGKAAYRGDKLTRRTFAEMLDRAYVAQEIVPPSERTIALDGGEVPLKLDLRNYVYDGRVQLVAARLYQGQTTNFRTPGGGFAPVFTERA